MLSVISLEQCRVHATDLKGLVDISEEVLVGELPWRNVDRHQQRRKAVALPGHVLLTSRVHVVC